MKSWLELLINLTDEQTDEQAIFATIQGAAAALGFEYCAFGFSASLLPGKPKVTLLSNYPAAWRERYAQAAYVRADPTVLHGRKSTAPLVWHAALFAKTPAFWDEAQSFGLQFGWAQSSLDGLGAGGMLTLARSSEALSAAELAAKQSKMRWLVQIAHLTLARAIRQRLRETAGPLLTAREIDVLKWTADGKSALDVADILLVSKNTVDFHIKNAMSKLQSCNKTAAVVQAAMLGYLN